MEIKGIEGLGGDEILHEIERGGRFVLYQYCVSILVMTFRRPSAIHFVRADENPAVKGLAYSVITSLVGWWGFPWGPIYSIQSLAKNFGGGTDVTSQIVATIANVTAEPDICEEVDDIN